MDLNEARKRFSRYGINVDEAIERLAKIQVSMNCWQGDDIKGFENKKTLQSNGIQSTGNYPGKAGNIEELKMDIEKAYSLIPGTHRLNLHTFYGDFGDENVERDQISEKHFKTWVDFAKKNGIKLDFNGTYFSHPKAKLLTLSSSDENIRKFWIDHTKRCIDISTYFANELDDNVLLNIWIPDGLKDVPADRFGPRKRLKESLDEILAYHYDKDKVSIAVESKLFGIGVESYTVGSQEFYTNYAAKNGILCLLDSGHFHPTENIADKLSSYALFFDKVALHLTRAVRWDSDHVIRLTDDIKEICSEIVKLGPDKFVIGVDFFDGSINRIAAWVTGMRNVIKSLLYGLLQNYSYMTKLQNEEKFTELLVVSEEIKTLPFIEVWDYYCEINNVPKDGEWFEIIERYEKDILLKRD